MWIAYAQHAHGTLLVDDGARKVLLEGGKSLLPAGVTGAQGDFVQGEAVSIADQRGRVFARGIARWSREQVERCMGKRSDEVRRILGEETSAVVVHRDDLTILPSMKSPEPRKGSA
jgi:glutamate 5-kinase